MIKTKEGGVSYEHSMNHAIEFFSKAGSRYDTKKSKDFYSENESALSLFKKVWITDKPLAFKLLLWLRDARGGAGNRSGFRSIIKWLSETSPAWVEQNIDWIPNVGRWDDLRSLFNSSAEEAAVELWMKAMLKDKNVLSAKWADRTDKPLFNYFRSKTGKEDIGEFRRFLANMRKGHIVEYKMCSNQWNEIEYEHVPSVAMARYNKAFMRHDEEGFTEYKNSVEKGEKTIKADVLFPHDCVRTALNGDPKTADLQFNAMPNYLGTDEKIIVIADTSGSMNSIISGSVQAVHVSVGLALYCSDKIGKDNPFYRKFLEFSCEGHFKDWSGMKFSQAINNHKLFSGAVGATRIDKALDLILDSALELKIADEDMPSTLLIVSDMQFHEGTTSGGGYLRQSAKLKGSEVEIAISRWKDAGYSVPKIVYWNTAAYSGSPAEADTNNIALVSGFSPSILKAIFSGEDFSPVGIMLRALEKYRDITIPSGKEEKNGKDKALDFIVNEAREEEQKVSKTNLFSNVVNSKKKVVKKALGNNKGKQKSKAPEKGGKGKKDKKNK